MLTKSYTKICPTCGAETVNADAVYADYSFDVAYGDSGYICSYKAQVYKDDTKAEVIDTVTGEIKDFNPKLSAEEQIEADLKAKDKDLSDVV